jgi:colanic acid biosynthesis glycosyl transferase WcaI
MMIPNWIHGSLQSEIERQAALNRQRESKLLFYSGNLGVKQGLPDFLGTFESIQSDWKLKIHGGGAELEKLRKRAALIQTVQIGNVLGEADYISTLQLASACLITQRGGLGANFLPSKILPALASGTPVLAVCEPQSPLGQEVAQGGFGVVVRPGDAATLKHVLDQWGQSSGLLAEMGAKAKMRALHYSRNRILPQYEQELSRVVKM